MTTSWKNLGTGAKFRRAHTLFWWTVAFPIMLIVLAYTATNNYIRARVILDDHSIAQATVAIDEDAPPSRSFARFKYTFVVDGREHVGTFSTLGSSAEDLEIGSTIPIAYANFDPLRIFPPRFRGSQ